MTPSQTLARIEALGCLDAKYIVKIRKQIEDPTKVVKSQAIVKFLYRKNLITKADAKKLLAPPSEDEIADVKPPVDSTATHRVQTQPTKPTVTKPVVAKPVTKAAVNPFNDAPNHVPVRRFRFIYILGFLNFHRRFIIGALLIAMVGYLWVHLKAAKPDPVDDDNDLVVQVSDSRPREVETTLPPVESTDLGSSETVSLTVDQQINSLLDPISNSQDGLSPSTVKARLAKIEKLISRHDLKPRQRDYCVRECVKAVGTLSELNQKVTGGIEGIDEKIANTVQAYEKSEDDEIAALTKSVFVSHLARRFTETRNEESFEAFKVAFLEKRDAIAHSEMAKRHMTCAIRDSVEVIDDPRLHEIAEAHLLEIMLWNDTVVIDLTKNLYFPAVDWRSLGARIKTRSPGADTDVQKLLATVKEHPDAPPIVYLVIALSIGEYQVIGEDEKAKRILSQLEEVVATITSKRIRDEVQKEIQVVKANLSK